jgi:hypothetical protein
MRIALFCLTLLAGAAALAACGGGGDSTGNQCFLDEGRFRDLAAGSGTTPRFTWCGAPAKTLNVRLGGGGSSAWTVDCQGNPPLCIDPPVTYADTVSGTTVLTGPLPLQTGTGYELCLSGSNGRPATVCQPFTP